MPDLVVLFAPDRATTYTASGAPYRGGESGIVHAPPEHVAALLAHGFTLPAAATPTAAPVAAPNPTKRARAPKKR